jgi:geranylgeranyl pyrophosphate synthase
MNFEEFLFPHGRKVQGYVMRILRGYSVSFGKHNKILEKKFTKFEEASVGGKCLRGALVLLGYKIAGGKSQDEVLNAAAAIEIFQTAILSQDDFIDKSKFRRGRLSLYRALGGDHKAISETICLSDLGFFICFKLVSNLRPEAIKIFSEALVHTALGEMLDVDLDYKKSSEKDVLTIADLKTANYTFAAPLAVQGGGDQKLLAKIRSFSTNLGIAFQIQDDILGVFGNEKILGKSTDSDIKEAKVTFLIARALETAKGQDLKILKSIYGKQDLTGKEKEVFKQTLLKLGVLEYVSSLAESYFDKALDSLNGVDAPLLYSLVDYLRLRKK